LFEQIGEQRVKDMIDAFFDLISDSLVTGVDVEISSFEISDSRKAPR
jgi:integration host factor subunit alpha